MESSQFNNLNFNYGPYVKGHQRQDILNSQIVNNSNLNFPPSAIKPSNSYINMRMQDDNEYVRQFQERDNQVPSSYEQMMHQKINPVHQKLSQNQTPQINRSPIDFSEIIEDLSNSVGNQQVHTNYQKQLEFNEYQDQREEEQIRSQILSSYDNTNNNSFLKSQSYNQNNNLLISKTQKSSIINSMQDTERKVNIHNMISQLDDLKDSIKSLEKKIDYSSSFNTLKQSKQKLQDQRARQDKENQLMISKTFDNHSLKQNKSISWNEPLPKSPNKQNQIALKLPLDQQNKNLTRSITGSNFVSYQSSTRGIEDYQQKRQQALEKKQERHKSQGNLAQISKNQKSTQQTKSQRVIQFPTSNSKKSPQQNNEILIQSKSSLQQSNQSSNRISDRAKQIKTELSRTQDHQQSLHLHQNKSLHNLTNLDRSVFRENDMTQQTIGFGISQNQQELLNIKIKEAEVFKMKYKKSKKREKRLKEQLEEKDSLLANYKNLVKEIKLLKEQWKMSEDLRVEQQKSVKALTDQLRHSQKENGKLKHKINKISQKFKDESIIQIPIKVTVEDRNNPQRLAKTSLQRQNYV